jgi:hypothetical protein
MECLLLYVKVYLQQLNKICKLIITFILYVSLQFVALILY